MEFDEIDKMMKKLERGFKELEDHIMRALRDEVRKLYEDLASMERMFRPMWHHEGYLEPLYAIKDLGDRIVVYIDLPFAEESTIDVKFVDDKMVIRAKLKKSLSYSDWSTRFEGTSFSEYRTVIDLPIKASPERVKVRAKRGVVEITIFK